jgi:hypothetical protein
MTLAETLLPKLSEWRPTGPGRHSWGKAFPEHGWAVSLAADRAETLGCLAWELTVQRSAEPAPRVELRPWADRVAGRVTGLLEPLRLLEVDEARGEAVLRSDAPARKGEALFYYEVKLEAAGRATVRRFQASQEPGHRREQVGFALTHEALAKLADDLTRE